jgi:AraC-like DNA-binding protein/mannose-6-phosphate isomerase-like protein (cupin superfamily)
MYLIKESLTQLNRSAVVLRNSEAAYRIHYWGINPEHYNNPVHKHSFYEVCFVLSGSGSYLEGEVIYPLESGTFFCSKPYVTHQIISDQGMFLMYVAFDVDEAHCTKETIRQFRLLAEEGEVCLYNLDMSPAALLWKSLLMPSVQEHGLPLEQLSSVAHALLSTFPALFLRRGIPSQRPAARPNIVLQRAKLYIRDNLDQPLTMSLLAEYLNVSERHLSRLFSEGIHESFHRFVRKERIRQAAYLLKRSEHTIKEIAHMTGFSSVHSFTRAFSAELDVPPGKFRAALHI